MKVFGLNTNFEKVGVGENILFLHGWGSDMSDFLGSFKVFSKNYCVTSLDLWGFGKSDMPNFVWGCDEYVDAILKFIKILKLKDINIVGHSFGGKLAIKLCVKSPETFKSLILVDSSGVKPKFNLLKALKIKRYKRLKKLVELKKLNSDVLKKFGSDDFKNCGGIKRQIMVKVVNENCESDFEKLKQKTLIFWGKKDKDTPLYMAKKMRRKIKNSELKIYDGGHFSHIDNFEKFNEECLNFWRKL